MTPALDGRHAVVTGGGRGIGAAIASALAAAGAKVTLMGRSEAPLRERAATLPIAQAVRCDVTDEAGVAAAFAEATRTFGPVGDPGQQRRRRGIGAVCPHLARAVPAACWRST